MNGTSPAPKESRIAALKSLIPEAFSEEKIDWEKLKAALGEDVNFSNERYVLNWAGKSEAFRVLQQPSSATLVPAREESVDFDNTQNIFIEGENLAVLKALQKSYFNKVKMIYIDPPYNTGNDSFIYPDKFSETKEEYLKRVGDKNDDGYMIREGMFRKNAKENGQYHSNWLNMMMPRLYLAKNLLRDDGVIFVSIDDNEVHNLRLLMNEIFGEENFVGELIWESKYTVSNDAKWISGQHEYILFFAKQKEMFSIGRLGRSEKQNADYKNRDNDSKGAWKPTPLHAKSGTENSKYEITFLNGKKWSCPQGRYPRYSKETLLKLYEEGELYFNSAGGIDKKTYLSDVSAKGVVPGSVLHFKEVGHTHGNNEELAGLIGKGMFDNPKGIKLIQHLLILANLKLNDVILDFFAGSGTTAHAVMQLNKDDGGNRKYICVQLPELCDEKSEAYKAGYKTIAEVSKERIRRAGDKIRQEIETERAEQKEQLALTKTQEVKMTDLGFKVFKLSDSNFKQWQTPSVATEEVLSQQIMEFVDPVSPDASLENMVYELLLKSGKSLNSTISHGDGFYNLNSGELVLILESVSQKIVDSVLALSPQKVIALDRLFSGNDQLKTNTVLQFRDAGVEFQTI